MLSSPYAGVWHAHDIGSSDARYIATSYMITSFSLVLSCYRLYKMLCGNAMWLPSLQSDHQELVALQVGS